MNNGELSWITNFIWGIADDVLRDLYVRGKYRDVILPMTVLRRLDAVLEPTKAEVISMKAALDKAQVRVSVAAILAARLHRRLSLHLGARPWIISSSALPASTFPGSAWGA